MESVADHILEDSDGGTDAAAGGAGSVTDASEESTTSGE